MPVKGNQVYFPQYNLPPYYPNPPLLGVVPNNAYNQYGNWPMTPVDPLNPWDKNTNLGNNNSSWPPTKPLYDPLQQQNRPDEFLTQYNQQDLSGTEGHGHLSVGEKIAVGVGGALVAAGLTWLGYKLLKKSKPTPESKPEKHPEPEKETEQLRRTPPVVEETHVTEVAVHEEPLTINIGDALPSLLNQTELNAEKSKIENDRAKGYLREDSRELFILSCLRFISHQRQPLPQAQIKGLAKFTEGISAAEIHQACQAAMGHAGPQAKVSETVLRTELQKFKDKAAERLGGGLSEDNVSQVKGVLIKLDKLNTDQREQLLEICLLRQKRVAHHFDEGILPSLADEAEGLPGASIDKACSTAINKALREQRQLRFEDVQDQLEKQQKTNALRNT